MKTRNFALCALGLAAAITFGGAATASAQARSDTRIPVRKDQPAPAPTVTDTVRIVRVDTVTLRGRVDTVTVRTVRTDTVTQMQMLPVQKLPGVYFGLGAGVAIPYSRYRSSTKDGLDLQAQLGWFPKDAALGLRLTGDAIFFRNRDTDCPNCPTPRLYQGAADVLLRFPLDRTSKLNPVLYFLGGGGINKFQNFLPYRNKSNAIVTAGSDTYLQYPGLNLTATQAGDKSIFFSYEGGLGMDFNAGPAHMYVESKFVQVQTTGGPSRYIPIVAGFKFY
ncbi:MAG: hypothetical protein JWL61_1976 [Gemmatimonadetes bacterium]|nr:hypothetical protein [Gemmatimonadota bacterium]